MISVVLYGRNDAHGYNLHRRAALSLNCIAEVLTDPDDEVIFVDYNTPDELPTFIEAISDTLTERCLDRLRVLRVPEAVHEQRFAGRTHLPALEPIARNSAARRANPANRWLLSTNTDMIFVPLRGQSMSEICADLPDGYYGLPRFELPEWLWEWLPRTDPARATAEIGRLGPALRLDEPTVSHEWIRFDAPGDCQLILREDFEAVDGFDEEMIHGYHVDSNLSRRLLLHRGSIETLEPHLSGYHCNHNRTRTVYHGTRVANDLNRFFFSVEQPDLPAQRATWGLAEVALATVPMRGVVSARCVDALVEAIPPGPQVPSDAYSAPFALAYDSGHVLPFVADALVLAAPDATIGYLGANTVLQTMLGQVVERLGFARPMKVARFDDVTMSTIDELADTADVFVVDLGLDHSMIDACFDASGKGEASSFPPVLAGALVVLDRLVERERERCGQTQHPRPMFLLNSSSSFWDTYVLTQFDCSYTTVHSRVRRATVKLVPEGDQAALKEELWRAHKLMRWWARRGIGTGALVVRPGKSVEVAGLQDYSGFGAGWPEPEKTGIWTEGPRSELRLAVSAADAGDCILDLTVAMVCVASNDILKVHVDIDGDRIATRRFNGPPARPWRIELPSEVVPQGEFDLILSVDEPRSPLELGWSSDDRRLGVHVRDLSLQQMDRSLAIGETVTFTAGSDADRFLGDGWSALEPTGVWTDDETARLAFRLTSAPSAQVRLILDLEPFVTAEHRAIEAEISVGAQRVVHHTYRFGDPEQPLQIDLPPAAVESRDGAVLEFHVHEPARPVDFGVGDDPRRLGVQLRSLTVVEQGEVQGQDVDADLAAEPVVGGLRKLRSQLSRSVRR
ncbi:MAG: hypothetical protein WAU75_02805 [Solirubrobacteraceae bacterium]